MYINAVIRDTDTTAPERFYAAPGYTIAVPEQTIEAAAKAVERELAKQGWLPDTTTGASAWHEGPSVKTTSAYFVRGIDTITVALAKHQGPRPDLVCTRHTALTKVLLERGIIDDSTRILEHAKSKDVERKHVLGILPHHLSERAATITEIPMRLDFEDRKAMQRGDLTLERTREVAGDPVTYRVQRLDRVPRRAAAIEAAITTCTIVEDCTFKIDGPMFVAEEYVGQFTSEVDLRRALVRHHGPHGSTPWLDPLLSTGEWVRGEWVGESECAIADE